MCGTFYYCRGGGANLQLFLDITPAMSPGWSIRAVG
jgi:hypothetical protein